MSDVETLPETKERPVLLPVARGIARSLWAAEYRAANPDADTAARQEAWLAVRKEKTAPVLEALRALRKRGFTFGAPVNAGSQETEAADDAE